MCTLCSHYQKDMSSVTMPEPEVPCPAYRANELSAFAKLNPNGSSSKKGPNCLGSSRTLSPHEDCHLLQAPSSSNADSKDLAALSKDKSDIHSVARNRGNLSCTPALEDGVDPPTNEGSGMHEVVADSRNQQNLEVESKFSVLSLDDVGTKVAASADTEMVVCQTTPLAPSGSVMHPAPEFTKQDARLHIDKRKAVDLRSSSAHKIIRKTRPISGARTSPGALSLDAMDLANQAAARAAFLSTRPVTVMADIPESQNFLPGSGPGLLGAALYPGIYIPTDLSGHIENPLKEPIVLKSWGIAGFCMSIYGDGIHPCEDMMVCVDCPTPMD